MAQKTVARSVAQARYVALGAVHLAERVAREFDRHKLEIQLPPGEEPLGDLDLENHQRFAAEWLMAAAGRLTEADKEYELQKGETRRLRRLRDERARELYEAWVPIRKMVSRQYPRSVLFHLLGYEGKTPREPMPLLSVCQVIVERARDESIELPPPRLGMLSFSREGLAAKLEPLVEALEQAIEAVMLAGREEDVLLMKRDQAWAKLRQVEAGITLFLEGLYRAAQLHDLVPGIRHPRGSAARRKARTVKKQETATPQKVEAVEAETTALHRKMAGAFLETTAPHQVMGRLDGETTLPHQVEARAVDETTAVHQVEERFEAPTTAPHHLGGAVEGRTTPPHQVGGAVEERTTTDHASVGGFDEPETPSPRLVGPLRLVKTATHGSVGGFGEPEPADHLSDGGFGDLSSAEHGSAGAVGEVASPGRDSVGGLGEPDSAEAGSGRGVEELISAGAHSDDGVHEQESAPAGSLGRFWHAATLRKAARKLVRGARG